jgi:sigma-B regulation protein RsbU (phosphoserine phosphatase)
VLLHTATAVTFLGLVFRYLRTALSVLIWRLRHRLLITYLFIGVVPVLLVLGMAAIAGYFFYGQVATYMANSEIEKLQQELALAAQGAALELAENPGADVTRMLKRHLPSDLRHLEPRARLLGRQDLPDWVTADTAGLVPTEDGIEIRALSKAGGGQYLMVSAVMERALSQWLPGSIGVVSLAGASQGAPRGVRLKLGENEYQVTRQVRTLPPRLHWADVAVRWLFTVQTVNWDTGKEGRPAVFVVETRPGLLNARLFSTLGELSRLPLIVLAFVGILFLLIECGALLVGVGLTRSITGAVHDLYEGTQRVNRGDFSYRIPVRSRDQLSALSESFNNMTVSLERLIAESKERERLQSELQIALEVQKQLFPKVVPRLRGLELAGVCRPARMVSGDYYDFVSFDESRLALAIGDIAGKGISAALVMAGMQSALHAQLYPWRKQLAQGNGAFASLSTAMLVAQLNRQLYENTGPQTFATFCYALYDDTDGRLTYTNAGHLAPVIVSRDGIRRLDRGGLVMGVLPEVNYEQDTIFLRPGDLLVAYTDGITEPENTYRGEFGEERLVEVVSAVRDRSPQEVAQAVLEAVEEWTDSPEAADDMTLLVARRL